MPGESKFDKARFRVLAVELLRSAKSRYSYKELSAMTGIDGTILSRYVTGSIVPSYEHAERIWRGLRSSIEPRRAILESASLFNGVIDLTPVVTDPLMLKLISLEFYERFKDKGVSKILVPETSGISLASAMSLAFNVPMVIARRRKHNPYMEYIEEHIMEPPTYLNIFYIPKRALTRWDKVLIVDDIIQSGMTLSVMEKLVRKTGSKLAGVAALVVIGGEWRKRTQVREVEALITLAKT
ncbi:MAG: hypothetical protein GSR85_08445 [Desulfurococcales archaeon]|nr:hypothetical protein [Desulfurococcales archaeon]